MSSTARDAARQVQVIAADASNGAALAARLLAALEPAVGFDDAEVIAVDPDSLLFTRLLAYRGDRLPHFAFFLRDVYLVAREPDWLSFPRLLREGGGAAVFHERFELWLRAHPPAMSQSAFTAFWRAQQSPPGGGLRFGLAHRGNWVAVLQLARWTPGPGFSASHLDLLDRLAPTLGLAFARTLAGTSDASASRDTPAAGHMTFSQDRRLVAIDSSGDAWLERLPDDGLRRFGVDVPIAVQSVVNLLWTTGNPSAVSHVADRFGVNVTIQGERARSVGPEWRRVARCFRCPSRAPHGEERIRCSECFPRDSVTLRSPLPRDWATPLSQPRWGSAPRRSMNTSRRFTGCWEQARGRRSSRP